jgi:arginyl-tRNA synthetase
VEILNWGEEYGKTNYGKRIKTQVEFVSANPTGPLTIGHGRQAVLGDTIARILEWHGYDVVREYYFNDAGRQIRLLGASVYVRYMEIFGETIPFPVDGYQGEYIKEIAKKLYNRFSNKLKGKENDTIFSEFAVEEVFKDIRKTLNRLNIHFDVYYNEKSLYESGKIQEVLKSLDEKGYLFRRDGAIWFKSTIFHGDKNRVLVKSTGEPTYRLPDITYHVEKYKRGFKKIVDIFGADHSATYPDVIAGLKALGYDTSTITVLIHQFVTLSRGEEKVKMSTRKATFVTLDELIDLVGSDVVRYFYLMRTMTSHLNFDIDLAQKQSEENPVFYIQYAHARVSNILNHAREKGYSTDIRGDPFLITEGEAIDLINSMTEFPEVMETCHDTLEPQHLTSYLYRLAGSLHKYYTVHRVVTENQPKTQAHLMLVRTAKNVLASGLKVLGISAPHRM